MNEIDKELAGRLVTGHKRDGRCTYDRGAKAEIVQVCLQPGVSVARVAMQYGLNANLVRAWISKRHEAPGARAGVKARRGRAGQEFVALPIEVPGREPVREPRRTPVPPAAHGMRLQVRLPNGVEFDLSGADPEGLSAVIGVLGTMGCSGSTPR